MKKPAPVSGNPTRRPGPELEADLPSNAPPDDGTSQLLRWGGLTLGTGLVFALLTRTIFGGIGPQGPHTNSGWMALIVTMMCLPFGFMLFLLGALKWLRRRRDRLS